MGSVTGRSHEERRAFIAPPVLDEFADIDLELLDPANVDDRHLLILAEHPDLERAIEEGRKEIHLGGRAINPVLQVTMHEIVSNQLWADEPPEMWATAQRLQAARYERHEVLHMLGSVVATEVFDILRDHKVHDIVRVRAALAALPGSWEQDRSDTSVERHQNRSERRAPARKHRR
jgi:hypothetical protein